MHGEPAFPHGGRYAPAAAGRDRRRATGRQGEQLARAHLRRLGWSIIARNARTRHGEIDLVAFKDATLVFVAVKTRTASERTRRDGAEEQPLTWLRPRQRVRLRRLAVAWLAEQRDARLAAQTIRFDAVGVLLDRRGELIRLDHLEGAW